jgi:hypothetical protein
MISCFSSAAGMFLCVYIVLKKKVTVSLVFIYFFKLGISVFEGVKMLISNRYVFRMVYELFNDKSSTELILITVHSFKSMYSKDFLWLYVLIRNGEFMRILYYLFIDCGRDDIETS